MNLAILRLGGLKMTIGERIRFFRNRKGLTQKQLGMMIGYSEKTADIRIAQYESGSRKPKKDTIEAIAYMLEVSPIAINVPNIEADLGIMHTLFTLEDTHGLHVEKMEDGRIGLIFDPWFPHNLRGLCDMVRVWYEEYQDFKDKKITKEEYDKWRYNYPDFDKKLIWSKPIPQDLSDAFAREYKKLEREEKREERRQARKKKDK